MGPGEEPPAVLWGLDPLFSAFARLFIRDILQMRESCQIPGIYFYNSHPIFKVDVLGTVVYRREREDFFCYGVDDGTGVINCLCWKNEQWRDEGDPAPARPVDVGQGGFNPGAELRRLREAQRGAARLDIGELLRVRGPVKTSRQQREIMASVYYKVSDPVMALQIAWMMEAPRLYRLCYDQPFTFHQGGSTQGPAAQGDSASLLLSRATCALKDYLREKRVSRFRTYDVQDLLEPLITSPPPTAPTEQEAAAGPSAPRRLRQLLQESLRVLQDEGVVFRKVKSQDEVFHVTEQDKDLRMATRDVIAEDSRREKYAERGCHTLHILSAVRQRYSQNLSKAALELVLKALECNSDIISTSDSYYTVL